MFAIVIVNDWQKNIAEEEDPFSRHQDNPIIHLRTCLKGITILCLSSTLFGNVCFLYHDIGVQPKIIIETNMIIKTCSLLLTGVLLSIVPLAAFYFPKGYYFNRQSSNFPAFLKATSVEKDACQMAYGLLPYWESLLEINRFSPPLS